MTTPLAATLFDDTPCMLGEGPLWHPGQKALFWFDILGQKLHRRGEGDRQSWDLPEIMSACGWVDDTTLMVASETGFWRFDITNGDLAKFADLEPDNQSTRSNDGRADPWGGFWIGTMGKGAEPGAGAIYRYYKGALTKLYDAITIPNAIAFHPSGNFATFADTTTGKVMRVALSQSDGTPLGEPEVFLDFTAQGLNPDGAVFDDQGRFWLAQWGASRVACYDESGTLMQAVTAPTPHTSCPAFGGWDGKTLFLTTAQEHLTPNDAGFGDAGKTFRAQVDASGIGEHQVDL